VELLARGTIAKASHVGVAGIKRNETGSVTETVVTFLLPVGAPITVDAPAPTCPL
jgi:hypothetical protein